MGFNQADVDNLLVACHRRCCICHRYCGFRMEVDHIVPKAEKGTDKYDNAIAVCFDCHAEIHHYNPEHAKGRRFRPNELKAHREQWLAFCTASPEALAGSVPPAEGGAIERLLNELMFNEYLAGMGRTAAVFEVSQFRRAIGDGMFSWLKSDQVSAIYRAYALISEINNRAQGLTTIEHTARRSDLDTDINNLLPKAHKALKEAVAALQQN
ncbi:MAG: HNH endonuclease [Planctomycetota bacterium]